MPKKLSRRDLRLAIQEAIKLSYKDLEGGARSEIYGGPRRELGFDEDDLFDGDPMGLRAMDIMGDPYAIDVSGDAMNADVDFYPSDDLSGMEREMSRQGRMSPHHHDDDYSDLDLDDLLREAKKPSRQELDLAADRVAHALDTVSRVVNQLLEMDFGGSSEGVYREAGDAVASLQRVMVAVKEKRDATPMGYRDDIGTRLDQYRVGQKRLGRGYRNE